MNLKEKNKYKTAFKIALNTFTDKLEKYVSTENGDWSVKGFIDVYKNIYTISSDTKIVSKILEIHIFPQILQFAEENGYNIILTEHQNYYPDLTFINKKNEEKNEKTEIRHKVKESKLFRSLSYDKIIEEAEYKLKIV